MPSEALWAAYLVCISTRQCVEPLSVSPPHAERAFQKTLWLLLPNCFSYRTCFFPCTNFNNEVPSYLEVSKSCLHDVGSSQKFVLGSSHGTVMGLTYLPGLKSSGRIGFCIDLLFSAFRVSGSRGENTQLESISKLVLSSLLSVSTLHVSHRKELAQKACLGWKRQRLLLRDGEVDEMRGKVWGGTVQSSDGHSWTGLNIGLYKREARTTREPRNC